MRFGHFERLIHRGGALPTHDVGRGRIFRTDDDHFAHVCPAVLPPVPHVERMHSVVGVPVPVHLDVLRVVSELGLVLLLKDEGVGCLRQNPMEELDVRRMMPRVEIVVERVRQDQHSIFLDHRHAAIHVVEIAERQHLYQERVENRVDVVGRDERDAVNHCVRLTFQRNAVLLIAIGQRLLVCRQGRARVDGDHLIRRGYGEQDLALCVPWQHFECRLCRPKGCFVEDAVVVFVLDEE